MFVGRVGRGKRPMLILDAVAALRKRGHAARAVFIGPFEDDAFEQEFRRLSLDLGLNDYLTITGHVAKVHPYLLSDASLFVLPSAQEGLPGALVEALAAGLPCAVTDVGSMGEVVRAARAGTSSNLPRPPSPPSLLRPGPILNNGGPGPVPDVTTPSNTTHLSA